MRVGNRERIPLSERQPIPVEPSDDVAERVGDRHTVHDRHRLSLGFSVYLAKRQPTGGSGRIAKPGQFNKSEGLQLTVS